MTNVDQVVPANCFAEGVPAVVKKENLTDKGREAYFGLIPEQWAHQSGEWGERQIKEKMRRDG